MNRKIIAYTTGWVLISEAVCLMLPLICALIYKENCITSFLWSILICLAVGGIMVFKTPRRKEMRAREGLVIVALSWIALSMFGALPFVFSKSIPNYIDALFETVSGFTTTGASILTDVEALPKAMLFWRSFTHWVGGMGVLVLLLVFLPLSGGNNMHLMKAESPGPSVSKLVPKVGTTAKILYGIYVILTLSEILILKIGGMDWFEALTLSFGTAGTGGFAVLNSGISTYSPYVQNVITVFMILFGIDFSVYFLLLIGNFRAAFKSEEIKIYLGIVLSAIVLITINCRGLFESLATTLRYVAFQVASVITTTGYMTNDFDLWPEFSKAILVLLMFFGACAGSTGGGIKVSRMVIWIKSIVKEVKIALHPKITCKTTFNGRLVEHATLRTINGYMAAYFVIFVVSGLLISLDGHNFTTNFTAVAATLNNIGPGLDAVGPTKNFADFSVWSKLVFVFDMLAGRLEIFPMLALFAPLSWKK